MQSAQLAFCPGTIMYVYLGHLVGDLATLGTGDEMQNPRGGYGAVGCQHRWLTGHGIAVTVYITKLARQALNNALPGQPESVVDNSQ
jgi:hypothetical protein